MEFAPSVIESRNKKKISLEGKDQSGSHAEIQSVPHLITGSALPSSTISTMMRGADSKAPLMSDRDLGEAVERGASAAWYAVARKTRNGARKGTAKSSFAENALQDSEPMEMMASPRSIASL